LYQDRGKDQLNNMQFLVILILGWPALIASLIVWLIGLVRKNYQTVVAAGIIFLPFAIFYLGASLNSRPLGVLFSLGHFASAYAIRRQRTILAWLLLAPYTIFISILAFAVLSQPIH